MYFHMDSIRKFKSYCQSWIFTIITFIIVGVRGGGNSKGEKTLLIAKWRR
jgi:hypothetical protein